MGTATEHIPRIAPPSSQPSAPDRPTDECVNPICEFYERPQFTNGRTACRYCRTAFGHAIPVALDLEPQPEPEPEPEPAILFTMGRLPSTEKKAFGVRFKDLRKAKNLSQSDLSRIMKVPRTYFSKLENCRFVPSLDNHVALANALGMTLTEFIEETWGKIIYSPRSEY